MVTLLAEEYQLELDKLANMIQESEELAAYLEEEEEEMYFALRDQFEPRIANLHDAVARKNPLQLPTFELELLKPEFEGLYLPKLLGYSVLRGELTSKLKYARPQEHFQVVLLAICNSANFDILKKRIGQSIQMGFAFSSDIWVTNLIKGITNRRVRRYLMGHKLPKYHTYEGRKVGLDRYKRQFTNFVFDTAKFPSTVAGLQVYFYKLKSFLLDRVMTPDLDNQTVCQATLELVSNENLFGTREHLEIMGILAGFFDLGDEERQKVAEIFNQVRANMEDFDNLFLTFILELHKDEAIDIDANVDARFSAILDRSQEGELVEFFNLMDILHDKGYNSEEAQTAVQDFYRTYKGVSLVNACVRRAIFDSFKRFINNLGVVHYNDYFEITKHFTPYMSTFANQKFNQRLKDISMAYIKKLLKQYTDKRAKDYQDIKKFVSSAFLDFQFLTEKEIKEFFKTKRKKKVAAE